MGRSRAVLFSRLGYSIVAALLILLTAVNVISVWQGESYGDLNAFFASGRAYTLGLDPYLAPHELLPVSKEAGPNANPPIWLLLFVPLSRLDLGVAYRLLLGSSLLLYIVCLALLIRLAPQRVPIGQGAWALAMTAPWYTLRLGQVYVLLLPFAAGAWYFLARDRRILAGLFLGTLIALKPNLAIWAVLLLVGGHVVVALTSCLAAGLISLLPLLVYGPAVYWQWLRLGGAFATVRRALPVDMSLLTVSVRLGLPWLSIPLIACLLLATVCLVWRLHPPPQRTSELALAATLLVSPRAWVGYAVLLLPLFLGQQWRWPRCLAAALLLVPHWLFWGWVTQYPMLSLVGLAYPAALLLLLADAALAARQEAMQARGAGCLAETP